MPSISCFYHSIFSRPPYILTFIQFEKFIKVFLNARSVILTNEELASNPLLFQIFILSLLLTEDTSKINSFVDAFDGKRKYGITTMRHRKCIRYPEYHEFTELQKSITKNPLKTSEPKRQSGDKKVRKFFKFFNSFYENEMIKDIDVIYDEFFHVKMVDIFDYFDRYIEHECKISLLSSIMHTYGQDFYSDVMRFM